MAKLLETSTYSKIKITQGILVVGFLRRNVGNLWCLDCSEADGFKGTWDSFNIVDVQCHGEEVEYQLNSTILI